MIPNDEKKGWCYLAVKNYLHYYMEQYYIEKHEGDFYCLNYLHFLRTESKPKSHEKVCKSKEYCGILMPSEKDNI